MSALAQSKGDGRAREGARAEALKGTCVLEGANTRLLEGSPETSSLDDDRTQRTSR